MTPGWLLEPVGNAGPRGMVATHRTRLTDLSAGRALLTVARRDRVSREHGCRAALRLGERRAWYRGPESMAQCSPVHEIVNALWRALHDLGSPATTSEIER